MPDYSGVYWRVNYGEIAERKQFRVGYVSSQSFDGYFEVAQLSDLITVLQGTSGASLGQLIKGSTVQARKASSGLTTLVVIEPRSDTFPPQIMSLALDTLSDLVYTLQLFQTAISTAPIPDDWDGSYRASVVYLDKKGAVQPAGPFNSAISEATKHGAYVGSASKPGRPLVSSVIERFAAGHGWTIFSGTAASASDDLTDYALGSQSFRFTTKTDNSAGSVQKTGYSVDLTGKQVILWIEVSGAINITELILYAGDATLANNYSWTIGDAGGTEQQVFRDNEWMPIVLSFSDGAVTGTPTRNSIATFRVRARATNGNSVTVRLGGLGTTLESSWAPNGVISIVCDDSYASQFDVLRPTINKYGWAATAYTIVDVLGTPGFMTLSQLQTLERVHGWEIGGHAFTSAMHSAGYGSGVDLKSIETDVRSLKQWLAENGFKGADHLAYPKGFFTTESQAVIGKYFATARTVTNRLSETIRPSDRMRLRSLSVTNTIPLSTAKALVDKIKAGKGWGIITIHDLVPAPTVGAQWATADFVALVDYIAAQGVPVLTVSEVVSRMNGSV